VRLVRRRRRRSRSILSRIALTIVRRIAVADRDRSELLVSTNGSSAWYTMNWY
jgi:hypothetical protein